MNENVRKIFNILGVEPNEKFGINDGLYDFCGTFFMSEDLTIFDNDNERRILLQKLLNGSYKIIKLPKKKKKLMDLTEEEFLVTLFVGMTLIVGYITKTYTQINS